MDKKQELLNIWKPTKHGEKITVEILNTVFSLIEGKINETILTKVENITSKR